MSDGMVFDSPEQIEFFRMRSLIGRLQLESRGLRFKRGTRTTLQAVQEDYGVKSRTYKGAYYEMIDIFNKKLQKGEIRPGRPLAPRPAPPSASAYARLRDPETAD